MSKIYRNLTIAVGAIFLTMAAGDVALAQCSRGGGSPRSTGSTGTFSVNPSILASASSFSPESFYRNNQSLAMRNQQAVAQQQTQQRMLAMRQQMRRQAAEYEYERDQNLLAMRRERAESNRAKRADRIAAKIAKRDSLREKASPGITEQRSKTMLTSWTEASPFE